MRSRTASALSIALLSLMVALAPSANAASVSGTVANGRAVLRNSFCRLELNTATGEIVSLTPGPASLRGPWLEVVEEDRAGMAPWETWKHGKESVFASGPATTTCTTANHVATALISWKLPSGLEAVARIRLREADKGPMFQVTVANRTGAALVDTIRVPILKGIEIGGPEDDWFAYPHTLGARYRVQGFKPGQTLEDPYPAMIYMQWLDLYDQSQGVYIGSLDDYGYSKKLIIGRGADGTSVMGIAFVGCWIARAGDSWTTPWVQVAAHKGDWHAGADLYRPFAEKAFGPVRPPESIREMPSAQCWLAHFASDGDVWKLFEIQQQAPIHASYLMKSLNTSTPEGWDGMRGSALELHDTFDNIRRLGGSPALFTFDRAPNMGKPNYANYVSKWICRRRDGSNEEGFRDMMPSPFDPDFVRARVGEAVRWVREFGLGEIHYDTEATCGDTGAVGTGTMAGPSYQMGIPQRPNEVPHYFKQLYRATVAACRRYNPSFILRAEHGADFFFPEFEIATAHFLQTATGSIVSRHNPPHDAQLMPELFRYTLPQHAGQQCPSIGMSDFWTYLYGMGHGFHGGGPSWCFNPDVREAESPGGELNARYWFYDSDWRKFYDFRVGFEEATIDAERSEVVAEALLDGKWRKCEFPGPVMAVTHTGGGREVTLGQWYPDSQTSAFSRDTFGAKDTAPRPIRLRVPTRLTHPRIRLFGLYDEIPAKPTVKNGAIELDIQDPTCFALEVFTGPSIDLSVPEIIQPGQVATIGITVRQPHPASGSIAVNLPAGWPAVKPIRVPAKPTFTVRIPVSIPKGIFGRNYPVKAVLHVGKLKRTTAAHIKVMEPLSVIYGFDALEAKGPLGVNAVDPAKRARLTVTCVNNTPGAADVSIRIAGEQVSGTEARRLDGIAPRLLGRADEPIHKWAEGTAGPPGNVLVKSFDYECPGVSGKPVRITVSMGGRQVFARSVWPRTRVMDLNGDWKVGFTPASRATVGGAERFDALNTEMVTPDVWDGKWQSCTTPIDLDPNVRDSNAWATYRRLVFIPAEWQGADLWLRLSKMGGPWGQGGVLNIVYVNGWPCGRIGPSGERSISSFVVYGGWNLIAVASSMPKALMNPYIFVRSSPAPERLKPANAGERPDGAFMLMAQRCTGQGISLPFIQGIPEGDHRRTNIEGGGENRFIHFAVADDFLYEVGGPVDVQIEYFDKGAGEFGLDYDSTDPTAPVDGAFKPAELARRTDTGEWKTHVFHLPDARLANHEHQGADFRVYGVQDDLLIRSVEVRKAL